MDRKEILEKVIELVSETLEIDEEEINEGKRFDDLGADSFDLLELVTAFEDEFGVTMDVLNKRQRPAVVSITTSASSLICMIAPRGDLSQ